MIYDRHFIVKNLNFKSLYISKRLKILQNTYIYWTIWYLLKKFECFVLEYCLKKFDVHWLNWLLVKLVGLHACHRPVFKPSFVQYSVGILQVGHKTTTAIVFGVLSSLALPISMHINFFVTDTPSCTVSDARPL